MTLFTKPFPLRRLASAALLCVPMLGTVTTPASAQMCSYDQSIYICMAQVLGAMMALLDEEARERKARHDAAILEIRTRLKHDEIAAEREIALYRQKNGLDRNNEPLFDVGESLTAETTRNSRAATGAVIAGPADPVELCWGGSYIPRSQCPPRP
jgi:hypothetical protein